MKTILSLKVFTMENKIKNQSQLAYKNQMKLLNLQNKCALIIVDYKIHTCIYGISPI